MTVSADKVRFPDDSLTTLAKLIANANPVADKDSYTSFKLQGEVILDLSEALLYVNVASDGATEDWQPVGSGSGTGCDGTSFTIDEDNTGSPVNMALKFNRGTSDDARLLWDEANSRFSLDTTSAFADLIIHRLYLGNSDTYLERDSTTGYLRIVCNGITWV